MKTEFTINLTEDQARKLYDQCSVRPGVAPESLIEAFVADALDLIHEKHSEGQ